MRKPNMMFFKRAWIYLVIMLLLSSGCAPVLSQGLIDQGMSDIDLAEVRQSSARFSGATLILGGTIIAVTNSADGRGELEILQRPLGHRLEPQLDDQSQGRFLVQREGRFEDLEFIKGRKISLAGRVVGTTTRQLDQTDYVYPQLEMIEYHLWPQGRGSSRDNVFFSIGLGATF
jgi:outer membrane lipoprotein